MIKDEQFKKAISEIESGKTIAAACEVAGFTERTFYNIVKKDYRQYTYYKRAEFKSKWKKRKS